MNTISTRILVALTVGLVSSSMSQAGIKVDQGPVNGVLFEMNGHRLAVYGWKSEDIANVDHVLLSHGRRDVVWKALPLVYAGARVIAPNRERYVASAARFPEFRLDRVPVA